MKLTGISNKICPKCAFRPDRNEGLNERQIAKSYAKLISFLAQRDNLVDRADILMVLGSSDLKVPIEAANLYKQGKAAKVVVCGGEGGLTTPEIKAIWGAEALTFKDALVRLGVPERDIYVDARSTNTQQNIENGLAIARANGIEVKSMIIVQNSVLQRRAGLTARKVAPGIKTINWAASIPDGDDLFARKLILQEMQKLEIYGPRGAGYIVDPEIPPAVKRAYERLV